MNNKKKKLNKYVSNIMTLAMMFMMISNVSVQASATGSDVVDGILEEVTTVLLTIAGLVCAGKLIQIGILYMTSSAVDKSNAKAAVLPWLIGTIVCFGAAVIGGTIIDILRVDKDVLEY